MWATRDVLLGGLLLSLPLLTQAELAQANPDVEDHPRQAATAKQCSLRRPVCVEGASVDVRRAALPLLEAAFELIVLGQAGPSWPLDPHAEPVSWQLEGGALSFAVDRTSSAGFDRGRTRCRGGEVTRASAIACVTGSITTRLAPATSPALTQGMAGYLALLHDGGPATVAALDDARRRPERGVLSDPSAPTAALLVEQLAANAQPGQGAMAPWLALLLPATKTKPGAPQLEAEPDALDALTETFGERDPHLSRFLDEMAVRRFSSSGPLGTRTTLPELAWDVDAASLPRNLVLPRPLAPTGSAYVSVRLDEATRRAGLALRTFCEEGSRYVWSLAKMDSADRLLGRVRATGRESGTNAEGVLRELDGVDKALIVGTSLGGRPGHELDPDETPFAEHSCEVVLDRLPSR